MGNKDGATKVAARRLGLELYAYQSLVNSGLKWCSKCKAWKPFTEFCSDSSRGEGLSARCRSCNYVRRTDGPSKTERIKKREHGFAWCSDCLAWLNIEHVTKSGRCRMHHNAYMRHRYATDEQYRLKWQRMVHARKRGIDTIDPKDVQELITEFNGKCAYCGIRLARTIDHIIPISRGGTSNYSNLIPACASCNSSKGSKDVFDWMVFTGKKTDRAIDRAIFVTHVL